jgi:hypothetical protein
LQLLDVLMALTLPARTVGNAQPLAFAHLTTVLDDDSRPLDVRCHAALGIGRAAYPSNVNFEPLAWRVADLALLTGVRFAQSENKKDPMWQSCGLDLFFAFRHYSTGDSGKGMLNRAAKAKVVADAGASVVSVAVQILEATTQPENLGALTGKLQELKAFKDANRPSSMTWAPGMPPLK